MISVEVKPCPFCGWHRPLIQRLGGEGSLVRTIQCGSRTCKCDMGFYPTEAEAIEAWNKRHEGVRNEGKR